MVCWAGVSFYECTAEFRFFWLNNKILETGACEAPSQYHRYRFSLLTIYNCDYEGLNTAYTGSVPYVKDGLAFYNKYVPSVPKFYYLRCLIVLEVLPLFFLLKINAILYCDDLALKF